MFSFFKRAPIVIPRYIYEEMIAHTKDEYPRECCGVLVGNPIGKIVFESHRVANKNKEGDIDRYIIDPKEIKLLGRSAKMQGLEIIGFYHSHPDQSDHPSQYDREMGEPGYSHVIISINKGTDISIKSWSFSDEKDPFKEEGIKIRET